MCRFDRLRFEHLELHQNLTAYALAMDKYTSSCFATIHLPLNALNVDVNCHAYLKYWHANGLHKSATHLLNISEFYVRSENVKTSNLPSNVPWHWFSIGFAGFAMLGLILLVFVWRFCGFEIFKMNMKREWKARGLKRIDYDRRKNWFPPISASTDSSEHYEEISDNDNEEDVPLRVHITWVPPPVPLSQPPDLTGSDDSEDPYSTPLRVNDDNEIVTTSNLLANNSGQSVTTLDSEITVPLHSGAGEIGAVAYRSESAPDLLATRNVYSLPLTAVFSSQKTVGDLESILSNSADARGEDFRLKENTLTAIYADFKLNVV